MQNWRIVEGASCLPPPSLSPTISEVGCNCFMVNKYVQYSKIFSNNGGYNTLISVKFLKPTNRTGGRHHRLKPTTLCLNCEDIITIFILVKLIKPTITNLDNSNQPQIPWYPHFLDYKTILGSSGAPTSSYPTHKPQGPTALNHTSVWPATGGYPPGRKNDQGT